MKSRFLMMVLSIMLPMVLSAFTPTAQAAPQTKDELKARFAERYPALLKLMEQGKIGETFQGFVEQPPDSPKLDPEQKKLIDDENTDRTKLYELLAKEYRNEKKPPTPAQVGERNARRKFQDAKPDFFLKSRDGYWFQRKDIDALKKDSKIGETWEGYVEMVKGQSLSAREKGILEEENHIRKEIYEREADKRRTTAEKEAQRAGKENLDHARSGEFIKTRAGDWEKKK